jgi:hypothetical protein
MLQTLAHQKRSPLPPKFKRKGTSEAWFSLTLLPISPYRWRYIPWYLKTILKGFLILFFILVGVSSAPKLKTVYESKIEKRLTEMQESTSDLEKNEADLALHTQSVDTSNASTDASTQEDELNGEEDTPETNDLHHGQSQLWRFTLKTASSEESRPLVVEALTQVLAQAGITEKPSGLNGTAVPGGIEFDLVLPKETIPALKDALHKIANASPQEISQEPHGAQEPHSSEQAAFTWYRVKTRKKLPAHAVQVLIWLPQPG